MVTNNDLDLDKLEALARKVAEYSDEIGIEEWHTVDGELNLLMPRPDVEFISACSPVAVLQLIELARRSTSGSDDAEYNAKLRQEVGVMSQMLDDGEWAEHVATTAHGQCLETAITKLVGKANGARVEASGSDGTAAAEPIRTERDGWEAAAKALADRAAGHDRMGNFTEADECRTCVSMLHDMKPAAGSTPATIGSDEKQSVKVDERSMFEAYMREEGATDDDLKTPYEGRYFWEATARAWLIWQARAALTQQAAPVAPAVPPSHWDEWALRKAREFVKRTEEVNHPHAMLVSAIRCLLIQAMEYAAPATQQEGAADCDRCEDGRVYDTSHTRSMPCPDCKPAATTASASLDDVLGPQRWSKEAEMMESWIATAPGRDAASDAPAAEELRDAKDAARYRWLRNPETDVSLVIDKRTGFIPPVEGMPGVGGYHTYEYRSGDELDGAIDAAMSASQGKETS